MKRIAFLLLIALSLTCITLPVSAQTETTVYSTAQRFDSGLMIWRSDTSLIWVLGNNGQAYTFPASTYANLPDNPIVGTPPSRLRPIFGFGKVWGNYPDVRNLLGWPTLPEIGFDMRIRSTASAVYLTQLDQSVYQVNTNGTWQYATNPPTIGPLIQSFTAAPSPVVPGGTITVNWQIARVDSASLEMYDQGNTRLTLIENLPASGSQTITAPPSGSARIVLWGVVLVRPDGYTAVPTRVISSEIIVPVQSDTSTTTTAAAAFQLYQKGYMVWEANTGMVMVFYNLNGGIMAGFPQSSYETLPDNPIPDVPAGCIRAINGFGRVWGNFAEVRTGLGCAVAAEQSYTMSITSFSSFPSIHYSFPDGRIAKVGRGGFWNF